MSEMSDDERWIDHRCSDPDTDPEDDMAAAIARGYERGRAEGAADRDRLAKRCEELQATTIALSAARAPDQRRISALSQRCAELSEAVKVLRREGQPSRALGKLGSRLAALEQRVGALVEITRGCINESIDEQDALDRLAALRSANEDAVAAESTETTIAYQRRKILALRSQLVDLTRERDALGRAVEEAHVERDVARESLAAREREVQRLLADRADARALAEDRGETLLRTFAREDRARADRGRAWNRVHLARELLGRCERHLDELATPGAVDTIEMHAALLADIRAYLAGGAQ